MCEYCLLKFIYKNILYAMIITQTKNWVKNIIKTCEMLSFYLTHILIVYIITFLLSLLAI